MITRKLTLSLLFCLLCLVAIQACKRDFDVPIRDEVWVPVYMQPDKLQEIKTLPARQPKTGGKIYVLQQYLFQLEPNQGIHVYVLQYKTPKPLGFIQVYGAQEIAIRNGILYTNNFDDIVALDLTDIQDVQVKGRVAKVFDIKQSLLPPEEGYFECVDPEKGIVIDWELKKNIRAKCKY